MTTQGYINNRWDRVQSYDTPTTQMNERNARIIPKTSDVGYDDVIKIDLGVIFVDISGFSKLVDNKSSKTVARIISLYVTEMAAAIRHHGGSILDIQGDGILGAFKESSEESHNAATTCVRASTTMQTVLHYVVNKKLRQFQQDPISCRYGMDVGQVLITKAGIRGEDKNDLVFIGNAINRAVKLQSLVEPGYRIISNKFYKLLDAHYGSGDEGWQWSSKNTDYGQAWYREAKHWEEIKEP